MSASRKLIEIGMIMANLKSEVNNFVLKYDALKKDYESERLAHVKTKEAIGSFLQGAKLDILYEAIGQSGDVPDLENLLIFKKRLEELEDANQKLRELYYTERKDLAQFREYADTYYPDLWDCFENSRARSKS